MWEFLDLIFFAAISGAYIWLFLNDRKHSEKPVINVTVNVPETKIQNNPDGWKMDTSGSTDIISGPKTKTSVIPIEEPKKQKKDWKEIKVTDSFNG